jgi:photosystem II stability/assembly factor-like uncharacterized protein
MVLHSFFRSLCSVVVFGSFAFAQSWELRKIESGGDLVSVYFNSALRGWVAGDSGYLAYTEDGGATWKRHSLNTTEGINEIYFRNEKNGYLVAGRKMFLTNDGGTTWRETVIFKAGDFRTGTPEFLSIRFADKKYGYVIGSILNRQGEVIDSLLMRTDDEGMTWRRQLVPVKTELFHLDFSGTSHGWIVGDKGLILATTDRGQTWHIQNSGTQRALFCVDFLNDDEGFAVGGGGTILRTQNGGNTWQTVRSSVAQALKRVGFVNEKIGWIVGFNGSILATQNSGVSWNLIGISTKQKLFGLYVDRKYGFAVGENGLFAKYLQ